MKKIIINVLKIFIKKSFKKDMKAGIGYKSIEKLKKDFVNLENEIKNNNNISIDQEITMECLNKGDLYINMKYFTYKHYLEIWEKIK